MAAFFCERSEEEMSDQEIVVDDGNAEVEINVETGEGDISSDVVNLSQSVANTVKAELVRINQGGAEKVIATEVEIKQGGANRIQAEEVKFSDGGAVFIQAASVEFHDGGVGAIRAEDVSLEDGGGCHLQRNRSDGRTDLCWCDCSPTSHR